MPYYSNDPLADFHAHDNEQEARLDKLPKCAECGEPIQQEFAVRIKGEWFCDRCLDANREECCPDY